MSDSLLLLSGGMSRSTEFSREPPTGAGPACGRSAVIGPQIEDDASRGAKPTGPGGVALRDPARTAESVTLSASLV